MLRLLLLLPALAALCRYTVRDVAFVDLGDSSYRLELRIPDPDAATLGAVATTLLDTNVTYEVDELEDLSSESSKATLHHPDGRSLDVDLWSADALDAVKLSEVIDSALRRRLLDEVFTHYAFCLLVEGEGEDADVVLPLHQQLGRNIRNLRHPKCLQPIRPHEWARRYHQEGSRRFEHSKPV